MVDADVVMLATPNIDYYANKTRADWSSYCARHGYNFTCWREQIVADMHVIWSKIEHFRRHAAVSKADWIAMVDADTYVNRPELDLDWLIAHYPGKEFLISEDCSRRFGVPIPLSLRGVKLSKRWRAPNCGFILARNNPRIVGIFDEWLKDGRGQFAAYADIFPREQQVFWLGPLQRHEAKIAVIGAEVLRIGTNALLDRLTLNTSKAFICHDKQMTNRESA